MKLPRIIFIVFLLLGLSFQATSVFAQITQVNPFEFAPTPNHSVPGWIFAQKSNLSPSEAAKIAQSKHGGKVVGSPRCRTTDSGTVCTVKLDINGRIKTVTVRG